MAQYDLDSSDGIQEISATALPLPAGASTSANQSTIIASLSSIDAGTPNSLGQKTMANSMPVVIASDQTAIPVSMQSSELATFSVVARDVAIGNNKSMLSIVNAPGSSVIIKIRELKIVNVQNTSLTGIVSNFEFKRITGHTSGTAIVPLSYDTSDSLSSFVTSITGSTVSGEATKELRKWEWSSDEWNPGPTDTESNDHAIQEVSNLLMGNPYCKPITIRAGEGVTLKHTTNSTAGTFNIKMIFTQESV